MAKKTKISIVMPVYNGSLLIERCLNSVFNQIGNFNLEVIVIDDGSTDNSIALLTSYPKPIIILRQENQGPATARNKGIEKSTGKYLAFLDADDYWESTFLKETVTFLEKKPEAIAVSVGQIHKIINKPDCIMPHLLNEKHNIQKEGVILDNFYGFWVNHKHVCTGSVLMRTAIVKQTGGQRPELRITEDLEFWAYTATFGKWGFIPNILFVSDGNLVTKEQGWFSKNKKRWASAPTVEEWESRIIKRLLQNQLKEFNSAKGLVAKNLAYSMLLSNRSNLSRKSILKYKHLYPKDKLSRMMSFFSEFPVLWKIFTKVLFLREKYKCIS